MTSQADPRIHVDLAHLQALKGKARQITFLPGQPVHSILNGRHASRLKGRGLNFEELRHYSVGDDIRTIDWKVTARAREPYVRVYTEERDRPALLIVDQRMSMYFGSQLNMKSVTAAEAAALAAFRIRDQGDRVGGIVFTDEAIVEHRPQSSQKALNRFLASVASANTALAADHMPVASVSLNQPLAAAARIAKTNGLILVFSDFDGMDDTTEKILRNMAQRNDVIVFTVTDPIADNLPEGLDIVVSDGALQAQVTFGSDQTRARLQEFASTRLKSLLSLTRKYGILVLPLSAAVETLPQILELMGARRGRT